MNTRIDWLNIGKEHWEGKQGKMTAICKEMQWNELPCDMAFSQGYAAREMIEKFKMPKVTHVSDSSELAPFALIGVRAHYANADVDFFALDDGMSVCPLCVFVAEKRI